MRVEGRFRALGLETFLPRVPVQRQWKDRVKLVDYPLFPGYVFVRCAHADLSRVVAVAGVVSVVSHNGKPTPVAAHEIHNVRLLVQNVTGAPPERVPLRPGIAVRVMAGPLEGIDGVVIEQRNGRKFVVRLTTIGEGLAINIDDRLLKPISDPRDLSAPQSQ